jgi:hypothetical protein
VIVAGAIVVVVVEDVVVEVGAIEVDVVVVIARMVVVVLFNTVVDVERGLRGAVVVVVPDAGPRAIVVVVVVDEVDVVVPFVGAAPPELGCGTLFVTEVAESDAASLPAESCTAFASLLPDGSVYATVTD